MAWTNEKGFNFRESNAFVSSDGTNRIPDIGQIYPRSVTIDGDTFNVGWDTDKTLATGSDQVRDRNAALDARLAGIAFIGNSTVGASKYRINLPSTGTYSIRLAAGDADNSRAIYLRILDNTTALATFTNVATATGQWMDAQGTVHTSAANWTANNAARSITMATTTLFIEIGTTDGSGSDITALSHVSIVSTGGSATTVTPTVAVPILNGRAATTNAFNSVRIREVLINEFGQPVASQTNLRLMVWYGGLCRGAPDVSLNAQTTDSAGTTSWSISTGTLTSGAPIFYVAQDSLSFSNYTCGRIIPSYEV